MSSVRPHGHVRCEHYEDEERQFHRRSDRFKVSEDDSAILDNLRNLDAATPNDERLLSGRTIVKNHTTIMYKPLFEHSLPRSKTLTVVQSAITQEPCQGSNRPDAVTAA